MIVCMVKWCSSWWRGTAGFSSHFSISPIYHYLNFYLCLSNFKTLARLILIGFVATKIFKRRIDAKFIAAPEETSKLLRILSVPTFSTLSSIQGTKFRKLLFFIIFYKNLIFFYHWIGNYFCNWVVFIAVKTKLQ